MKSNKPIQTALSSFGMSGRVFHGPSLLTNPHFEVVSVYERTKEESKTMFPSARIVRYFEEIIQDNSVELVVINTPDFLHYPMAKQALAASKHVVVEKPFTHTIDQAQELISLAKKKKVTLSVYQNRRFDNGFLAIQDLLKQKMLGDIVEYQANFTRYRNFIKEATWKEDATEKNGSLYNLGSHLIDQCLVLFGIPDALTAQLAIRRPLGRVVDYFDIRLHYANHDCILRSTYLARITAPQFVVHGTLGSYKKDMPDPQEQQLNEGIFPNQPQYGLEEENHWGILDTEINHLHFKGNVETPRGCYNQFYENIACAIKENKELLVKAEEALNVIAMLELCELSHNEKRTVFTSECNSFTTKPSE